MIFDKRIRGVCMIASKDEHRPILSFIHVDGKKVKATDGYILMEAELSDDSAHTMFPDDEKEQQVTLVPASALYTQAGYIKKSRIIPFNYGKAVKTDRGIEITVHNGKSKNINISDIPDDLPEFPVTKNIMDPALAMDGVKICFDPRLMIHALQAMIASGVSKTVFMKVSKNSTPILLKGKDYENKEVRVLVMPQRMNYDEDTDK